MPLVQILPLLAAAAFLLYALYHMRARHTLSRNTWMAPALVCLLFAAWSLHAVIQEGPLGFWIEHTRNLWGVQVWFDLVIAVAIGWFFVAPRARAQSMRLPFWLLLVLCTGTVGFSAMFARLLYLEARASGRTAGTLEPAV